MKKPLHPVSDHAVLRYLERVEGMDIERIRRKIGRKVDLALDHPAATGVVIGAFVFKIDGGTVTTVMARNRSRRAHKRPKALR